MVYGSAFIWPCCGFREGGCSARYKAGCMMMKFFSLSTPALLPFGYAMRLQIKKFTCCLLPAGISITVQINAGSLEGATSGSYAAVVIPF